MAMPVGLFSSAFRQQRLGLMFSAILTMMVYLGAMAMAAQALLARTALSWDDDLRGQMTVELPYLPDEGKAQGEARLQAVVQALSAMDEVALARPVDEEETRHLIRPWVEDESLLEALPLPRLVEVRLKPEAAQEPNVLARALERALPPEEKGGTPQVHGHAKGMGAALGLLTGLGVIAGLMLLLIGFAVVMVVSVICRAALSAQRDTVELLYFMGAPDHAIAKQFHKHILALAVPAASAGFVLAVLTVALLAFLLGSLGGLSLIAPLSWVTVGVMMTLVPLGAVGLSVVSARASLLKLLRRLG